MVSWLVGQIRKNFKVKPFLLGMILPLVGFFLFQTLSVGAQAPRAHFGDYLGSGFGRLLRTTPPIPIAIAPAFMPTPVDPAPVPASTPTPDPEVWPRPAPAPGPIPTSTSTPPAQDCSGEVVATGDACILSQYQAGCWSTSGVGLPTCSIAWPSGSTRPKVDYYACVTEGAPSWCDASAGKLYCQANYYCPAHTPRPTPTPAPTPGATPIPAPTLTPTPTPTSSPTPTPILTPSPSPEVTPRPTRSSGVTCYDSDAQADNPFQVAGFVVIKVDSHYAYKYTDYCSGDTLHEYECISYGSNSFARNHPVICENGCEGGRCKENDPAGPTCTGSPDWVSIDLCYAEDQSSSCIIWYNCPDNILAAVEGECQGNQGPNAACRQDCVEDPMTCSGQASWKCRWKAWCGF